TAGTITGLGDEIATASDSGSVAATVLTNLDAVTTGAVGFASVTTLTGTATEIQAAYTANTAGTITGLGNEAVITNDTGTLTAYNTMDAATTGIITTTLAATGAADAFVFNNNVLTIGTGTAYLNGTDSISFVGAGVVQGTLAESAITNTAGDDTVVVDGTNTTVYVIDTDTNNLGGSAGSGILDFTSLVNVAAFLTDGITATNEAGETHYFVINDGDVATAAYVYEFIDAGGNTTIEAAELKLIGTLTTDGTATTTADVIVV
ncbi:MAG: hypothetical protein ACJAUI_000001, partial [Pseudohongiellaceae bacterium]